MIYIFQVLSKAQFRWWVGASDKIYPGMRNVHTSKSFTLCPQLRRERLYSYKLFLLSEEQIQKPRLSKLKCRFNKEKGTLKNIKKWSKQRWKKRKKLHRHKFLTKKKNNTKSTYFATYCNLCQNSVFALRYWIWNWAKQHCAISTVLLVLF